MQVQQPAPSVPLKDHEHHDSARRLAASQGLCRHHLHQVACHGPAKVGLLKHGLADTIAHTINAVCMACDSEYQY